jgi:ectoine hydroxylase-related dioxygenase (phytanoyl-CoA dioxygenase family)
MNHKTIRRRWNKDGYIVVPQLLDTALVEKLRPICDNILEQWLEQSPDPKEAANYTNMAYLTEARYFKNHPERRATLLEAIAHDKTLSLFKELFNIEPLFHGTQYFFEPASDTRAGNWHRDQQFISPSIEAEKEAMSDIGVHVHIALVPDNNLEIVPGTHARWDTPEELEIRKGLNGRKPNDNIPGATRVSLEAGDACFFSAWSIHRGHYIAGKVRRTFDVIYGAMPDSRHTPPPMGFLEPGVLDGLRPQAQAFFSRFIRSYRDKWLRGEYEV